ncbi:MAG: two-component regulator propeller domain-containing protein [Haliscomenobacter sp.]|uniref:hybrid sensor histidine kinase/response regulator transcription factor n=1 Tax=Haliscomenobacter sp. TaxID=2717303 RepID=UPI0029B366DD|nr:two-component regulator propeller domain-containing protein [Haliscomenobacter sp.]MDX2070971.1 two-component regulator propeller domain-containing protein [Haliscomenobacter sp.]
MKQISYSFFLFFFYFSPSFAQNRHVAFDRLGVDQKFTPSSILSIYQDSQGFIWVGGLAGLARFDGHEAKWFYYEPQDTFSLNDNRVQCMAEDKKGNLWIGTQTGLNYYDRKTEKFYAYFADSEIDISAILIDKTGKLWLINSDTRLYNFDPVLNQLQEFALPGRLPSDDHFNAFYVDDSGLIWLGSKNAIIAYDPKTKKHQKTTLNSKLSDQYVKSIAPEKKKGLWLGLSNHLVYFDFNSRKTKVYTLNTSTEREVYRNIIVLPNNQLWLAGSKGLIRFDPYTQKNHRYLHDPNDDSSISNDNIQCLFKDRSGIAWAGTVKGLFKFNTREQFTNIKNYASGLINNTHKLRTFYEESPGQLLLWGENRLEILDWKKQTREPFPYQPDFDKEDWQSGVICFFEDRQQRLWMGTSAGGVFVLDKKNMTYEHFKNNPQDKSSLNNNIIRDIIQDKEGQIWLATWYNGVDRFEEKTKTFRHYIDQEVPIRFTRNLYLDRSKNLWVGTRGGSNRYDSKHDRFINYKHEPKNPNSMSESTAFDIYEGENNNLWIGTYGGGLNKFNQRTQKFTHYTTKNGLIDNTVFCVLPDKKGNLWLSTFRGIVKFNPKTEKFTNYTQKDGLLNDGYDAFSYYQSPYTGHLFFEGPQGLDIFHPDSIRPDPVVPNVVFTDFLVSNKAVSIKKDEKATREDYLLPESISTIKKIVLPYRFKIIGFKYAGTHYANPQKNHYAYKLGGFDENWQYIGNQGQITFTNLNPGKYTLQVKASNADGVWNEKTCSIQIIILPPWWRTWWAYLLYVITFVGIILGVFRYQQERWLLQARLQMEQREAERLKELDAVKTSLYTNITHEFRTPLTVILGANDQIAQEPEQWVKPGTEMIRRNGKQLLNLINQMLDLRKLETGNMPIHWIQGNIVEYLRYLFDSFHSLAESKSIGLHFLAKKEAIVMDYDSEKILLILNNLLSNAIKFTPSAGQIYLQVDQVADLGGAIEIKLRDTGIGITEDNLPYIFDRFYQVDDSTTRGAEGTGIGLALVREMVRHLQGTLVVESEPGVGTIFTIQLPIHREAKLVEALNFQTLDVVTRNDDPLLVIAPQSEEENKPCVLIIEDNADVVHYLQACLANRYQVLVAINGEEGIQKAIERVPDAIISDVMMPIKDGFAVTSTLKDHEATSHIPIILLTAKADIESRIQGLRRGADDYLAKPFHKEELLVRLENLIVNRAKLQKRYASITQIPEPSEDINLQKEDEFIQKVREVLEQNYTEAEFKSPQFQRAMGMGRTQLHNKLKALTNLSTTEVINQFRVQKGKVLLETTSMNVSEVAYAVGYNDPKYFSERYMEEFGERPSQLRNKH